MACIVVAVASGAADPGKPEAAPAVAATGKGDCEDLSC